MSAMRPGTLACDRALIVRRYAAAASLSAADLSVLGGLTDTPETVATGEEIESEGLPPARPRILVSGWACRFRIIADGRRMIVGIIIPGDSIGLRQFDHAAALTSTAALCPCRLLSATPLQQALISRDGTHTALARAQRVLDTLEEAYMFAHIVRLGRMTAPERICHLLLELHARLDAVGLAPRGSFCLPLTYDSLADTVGLSVVHVNRTLQTLRREGMIELRQGRVRLLDLNAMQSSCDFRPVLPPPLSADLRVAARPH